MSCAFPEEWELNHDCDRNCSAMQISIHVPDRSGGEGPLAGSRPGKGTDAIALLATRYPVVYRLVGDDSFRMMARRYVLSELARSPITGEYGDTFPRFLRSRGTAASIDYVA